MLVPHHYILYRVRYEKIHITFDELRATGLCDGMIHSPSVIVLINYVQYYGACELVMVGTYIVYDVVYVQNYLLSSF